MLINCFVQKILRLQTLRKALPTPRAIFICDTNAHKFFLYRKTSPLLRFEASLRSFVHPYLSPSDGFVWVEKAGQRTSTCRIILTSMQPSLRLAHAEVVAYGWQLSTIWPLQGNLDLKLEVMEILENIQAQTSFILYQVCVILGVEYINLYRIL